MPSIEPDVEVTIEGIVLLGFETNAGQPLACVVGAVRDVPDHEFDLEVIKVANNTAEVINLQPQSELVLEVEGTSQQGIRFAAENAAIDRIAGTGDPLSFNWVLNFSGEELHNHPVPIVPSGFLSTLRITNGELFTKVVSKNHLLTREAAKENDPLTLVGKVATRIGVAIDLEPGGVARLSNGVNPPTTVQPGERLLITFKQTCPTDDPNNVGLRQAHANHYYNALGVDEKEQKEFSSTKFVNDDPASPPASPEASCYVGKVGP